MNVGCEVRQRRDGDVEERAQREGSATVPLRAVVKEGCVSVVETALGLGSGAGQERRNTGTQERWTFDVGIGGRHRSK